MATPDASFEGAGDPSPYGAELSRAARRNRVVRFGKGLGAYVVLSIFAVIAIGPFIYLLSPSFRQSYELFSYPPTWIPHSFYTGNFGTILHDTSYLRWGSTRSSSRRRSP